MVKRLIRDNILLKVIPEEDTVLASGIIMPSVRKDPRIKGEVVAVGPGLPNCPVTTRVGDTAYVERGIGQQCLQPW